MNCKVVNPLKGKNFLADDQIEIEISGTGSGYDSLHRVAFSIEYCECLAKQM